MPAKVDKNKGKAPSKGSKKAKKKWSKGKEREKSNHAVVFTDESYKKMLAEVFLLFILLRYLNSR